MSLGFFLVKSNFWIFRCRSLGIQGESPCTRAVLKGAADQFWSSSSCNLSNRCSCISARRMP